MNAYDSGHRTTVTSATLGSCLAKVDSGHSKEKNTTVSTSSRNYGCCVVEVDSGHKKMKRDNSFKSNYGCCVVEVDSLLRRGRETTVTTSTRVAGTMLCS